MSKRAIRPDDLERMQFVGDTHVSPDGQTVLLAKRHIGDKNNYVTNLWAVDVASGEARQWTSGGKDGHGRWSPDGELIAFISGREGPSGQIHLISSNGGEARKLTSFPEGSIGGFRWSPDGKWMAVSFRETHPDRTTKAKKERDEKGLGTPPWEMDNGWYRLDGDGYFGPQRYKLYLVNASTGEHTLLYDKDQMGFTSYDWLPNSSGLVIMHSASKNPLWDKPNDQAWTIDLKGKTKKIPCDLKGSKSGVRVSPNGKHLAWLGAHDYEGWGTQNTKLYTMPIEGGEAKCLTAKDDYDLDTLCLSDTNQGHVSDGGGSGLCMWTPDSKSIYVGVGTNGEVQLGLVDAKKGGLTLLTQGKHAFVAASQAAGKIYGTLGTATHMNELAVFDGSKINKISDFNKDFHAEVELAKPEDHWIESTDGVKVHTWIMRPAKAKKKNPAILEVHGGPHAQYGWMVFHEFQLLAAQGWVVVYSNPRGSKGYGQSFCEAIKGNWGTKDWDDVMAVTNWMKEQSDIDSKKIGIMGGSYGGYMTNWAVGHSKDYCAAITDRCVSNWVSMAGNSDFPMNKDQYFGGYAWGSLDKIENLWKQSPMAYFDKVTTPMLIIHSEGDLRCNVEQSDQVFHALQAQGIDSRYVRYPVTTSHGMSRNGPPDMRYHRLGEIVNWWKRFF